MPAAEYQTRAMCLDDVSAIMKIELQAYPYPWTAGIFKDCLRTNYYAIVFEVQSEIVAYAVMSSGGGEAHVLNICVHPEYRGRGWGRDLLCLLEEEALRRDAEVLLLEVRPSNTAAVALYESIGFNEIGLRKDYYPAALGREDALVMARQLSFGGN